MVSVEDSYRHSHSNPDITSHCPQTRPYYHYTPPPSSARISRSMGRSMRKIRSNIFKDHSGTFSDKSTNNLSESFIDLRLGELAAKSCFYATDDGLENSRAFSVCSSDISGELQRLASIPDPGANDSPSSEPGPEQFLERDAFSPEIIDIISLEDLEPTVKLCIEGLKSESSAVKRSAAAKLRLLAKNRADNRALIGESGAVPALIPLLRCSDPVTQEHAVTALLNLSLHESNKSAITESGAVKALIYVLKTGTEVSKQNAACALLSLALIDENRMSIGASGAIPPLIALLINGSNRGKKDSLTTLYKLCSVSLNKERAVCAGAVRPLLEVVGEQGDGLAEKAMVVLSSLAVIEIGVEAIVEEGGLSVLVEVIEDGSDKMKEFAVLTLVQLCTGSVRNRGLLVREGAIPPLVALSQSGTAKAKHKAETLLRYLREPRPGPSSRSP